MKKDLIDKIFEDTKAFLEDKQGENKNIIVNIKRDITTLETKKARIDELAINGTFDKGTYLKNINAADNEIISKKIQLSDYEAGILNIDELIDYGKRFVCNLSSLWLNLDTPRKRHLQEILFPEGIYLENGKFRTAKISPILKLIEDKNNVESILAGKEDSNHKYLFINILI